MNKLFAYFFAVILSVSTTVLVAEDSAAPTPVSLGFNTEKLDKLTEHFQGYVNDGRLAGLTTLVARHGEIVHFNTYGKRDLATGDPTKRDTIYRIYSMTKPITGIAMMMLYEEGKFKLDDPVSKYIPGFKNMKVYAGTADDGSMILEDQKYEVTIIDLMRHTSGLTYGLFGNHPVDKLYLETALNTQNLALTIDEMVEKTVTMPMIYQPGTRWNYSISTDIQGYLVAKLSGMTFGEFLEKRIFKPLKMKDTAFFASEEKFNRLSQIYALDKENALTVFPYKWAHHYNSAPTIESGGGGLVSTTTDYYKFAQMLLNGGSFDGHRLLKSETIALMTKNHLPGSAPYIFPKSGTGFGLNFAVVEDTSLQKTYTSKGEFFWGGLGSTLFWVDPKEDMVVILMTNFIPASFEAQYHLREEMRHLVYDAMTDKSK